MAPHGYSSRHKLAEQQDALEKNKPYEKERRLENSKMLTDGKPNINAQQKDTRPSSDEATVRSRDHRTVSLLLHCSGLWTCYAILRMANRILQIVNSCSITKSAVTYSIVPFNKQNGS